MFMKKQFDLLVAGGSGGGGGKGKSKAGAAKKPGIFSRIATGARALVSRLRGR